MKRTLLLWAIVLVAMPLSSQTKTALFIGNSYTAVNNLPATINSLANSLGDTLIYDSNTPGGHRFMNHAVNTTTLSKIALGGWDFVALQAQSQEPSFSPPQVANDVYPYATILVDSIKSADDCAEPLFYMTWGRKNGDATNCASYPPVCTYNGMQQRLRESYIEMAQDNSGSVSPVGAVWKQVRDSIPGLELYTADESHPSSAGTYVAACTFYTAMWRKSPVGASFTSSLSASDAAVIQYFAEKVVLDSLDTWMIGHADVIADFSVTNLSGLTYQFTDNSIHADSITYNYGDGAFGSGSTHTYPGDGTYMIQMIAWNECMSDTMFYELIISPFLSVNEQDFQVDLYPNPVRDLLNIRSDFPVSSLELYDSRGKLVLSHSINKESLFVVDLSKISNGVYQLKLNTKKGHILRRIVK